MVWRRIGDKPLSHYLNQCWPCSLTHICGTRGRWVNSLHAKLFWRNKYLFEFCVDPWHWNGEESPNYVALKSQYHVCWCPGDMRSQGISKHGIDLVRKKYCLVCMGRFNTSRVGTWNIRHNLEHHVCWWPGSLCHQALLILNQISAIYGSRIK